MHARGRDAVVSRRQAIWDSASWRQQCVSAASCVSHSKLKASRQPVSTSGTDETCLTRACINVARHVVGIPRCRDKHGEATGCLSLSPFLPWCHPCHSSNVRGCWTPRLKFHGLCHAIGVFVLCFLRDKRVSCQMIQYLFVPWWWATRM